MLCTVYGSWYHGSNNSNFKWVDFRLMSCSWFFFTLIFFWCTQVVKQRIEVADFRSRNLFLSGGYQYSHKLITVHNGDCYISVPKSINRLSFYDATSIQFFFLVPCFFLLYNQVLKDFFWQIFLWIWILNWSLNWMLNFIFNHLSAKVHISLRDMWKNRNTFFYWVMNSN